MPVHPRICYLGDYIELILSKIFKFCYSCYDLVLSRFSDLRLDMILHVQNGMQENEFEQVPYLSLHSCTQTGPSDSDAGDHENFISFLYRFTACLLVYFQNKSI